MIVGSCTLAYNFMFESTILSIENHEKLNSTKDKD